MVSVKGPGKWQGWRSHVVGHCVFDFSDTLVGPHRRGLEHLGRILGLELLLIHLSGEDVTDFRREDSGLSDAHAKGIRVS